MALPTERYRLSGYDQLGIELPYSVMQAPNDQVSVRWGQPIQTRLCGSNSAGMRKPSARGLDSDSWMVRIQMTSYVVGWYADEDA